MLNKKSQMRYRILLPFITLTSVVILISFTKEKKDENWTELLDQNLSQWENYLSYHHLASYNGSIPVNEHGDTIQPVGYNKNTNNVFSVVKDNNELALKVSGEYYGCVFTKKSYKNFHLKLKVKWGTR